MLMVMMMNKELRGFKKVMMEFLKDRETQLVEERNFERINMIEPEKKRHPAWKQLKGRIQEVRHLKKELSRLK